MTQLAPVTFIFLHMVAIEIVGHNHAPAHTRKALVFPWVVGQTEHAQIKAHEPVSLGVLDAVGVVVVLGRREHYTTFRHHLLQTDGIVRQLRGMQEEGQVHKRG